MFAVIFLPDFSLQSVLRHNPELRSQPVALVDPALPKPTIVQLTPAARSRGVIEESSPSQALARCAELKFERRSLPQEQAATEALLQTAYAFSPGIEATAPGICTLELSGLGLHDTPAMKAWAAKVISALESLGFNPRIGVASTPALALLAARAVPERGASLRETGCEQSNAPRSSTAVLVVQNSIDFVSALPVQALGLPIEIDAILDRWGIRTAGHFLALNKNEVAERLGPDAIEAFERVSSQALRPLRRIVPPDEFVEQRDFETEIETLEPLLFVLNRFVEQLSRRLELLYLVVAEFHLRLGLSSGSCYEHPFKIPSPTGNVRTLFRMLHTHLENVRTDAPVTSLRLAAVPCKPDAHQFGFFEATVRDPNQFAETLARLTALCGTDRVGTPQLESTHRPDAFRLKPWEGQHAAVPDKCPQTPSARPAGLQLRRFRPAISATIEFRAQRPVLCRSAVFNGAIADTRGPFFSSGDWWDRNPWSREEWDIQAADGALYRVFRSPEGCFVEGLYD